MGDVTNLFGPKKDDGEGAKKSEAAYKSCRTKICLVKIKKFDPKTPGLTKDAQPLADQFPASCLHRSMLHAARVDSEGKPAWQTWLKNLPHTALPDLERGISRLWTALSTGLMSKADTAAAKWWDGQSFATALKGFFSRDVYKLGSTAGKAVDSQAGGSATGGLTNPIDDKAINGAKVGGIVGGIGRGSMGRE